MHLQHVPLPQMYVAKLIVAKQTRVILASSVHGHVVLEVAGGGETFAAVGETGVGCHTGWLSHCQYLIRWMAVPCGDLQVTCA